MNYSLSRDSYLFSSWYDLRNHSLLMMMISVGTCSAKCNKLTEIAYQGQTAIFIQYGLATSFRIDFHILHRKLGKPRIPMHYGSQI